MVEIWITWKNGEEEGKEDQEMEMHTLLAIISWPILAKTGGSGRAVLENKIESLITESWN